ncbi:MAG: cytidine deaminase [Clostridiales bacterium]|jgi:cytidine deaminase|nr:cytidine deaminase [Clostridiales bacterium]
MRVIHDLEIKNMLKMAADACDRAYAPYSKFRVGACLKGSTGAYYLGGNVENSSYGATICAERMALCKAVYEGEKEFDAIAIYTEEMPVTPCGICRQSLAEFCDGEMPIICGNKNGKYKVFSLAELFPSPFSLADAKEETKEEKQENE